MISGRTILIKRGSNPSKWLIIPGYSDKNILLFDDIQDYINNIKLIGDDAADETSENKNTTYPPPLSSYKDLIFGGAGTTHSSIEEWLASFNTQNTINTHTEVMNDTSHGAINVSEFCEYLVLEKNISSDELEIFLNDIANFRVFNSKNQDKSTLNSSEKLHDLPKSAPVLWRNRTNQSQTPADFIKETYSRWIGRIKRSDIRPLDPTLYQQLSEWLNEKNEDGTLKGNKLDFDLPTKGEIVRQWVDRVEKDPSTKLTVKEVDRLKAAQYRRDQKKLRS